MKIPQEKLSQLCQHWHIHKLSLFGSVLRDDFRERVLATAEVCYVAKR